MRLPEIALSVCITVLSSALLPAEDFSLQLRSQKPKPDDGSQFSALESKQNWPAGKTAVIVCDVWDLHHCLNAVRRLEEFAPRLNQVLVEARRRGATIIHAPSDCMAAYENHPARKRALSVPRAEQLPKDIDSWCSRIPSEEQAVYPIDQSDGGEDDDPAEHAEWAAKLKALGRNPALPWKKQLDVIEIDSERDFISDRGSEVWSILTDRKIENVILTGVHCNMCVLGRPFGLRQLARNGKNVVLMRDMTDCMYNPKRWPFVDHFTGNDLMIAHVEKYVCPTITSDQILGGEPFRSKYDQRPRTPGAPANAERPKPSQSSRKFWSTITVPLAAEISSDRDFEEGAVWLRCAVLIPKAWVATNEPSLGLRLNHANVKGWINGHEMSKGAKSPMTLQLPVDHILPDEVNLLVLKSDATAVMTLDPMLTTAAHNLSLRGRWQCRRDDDPQHANMPLPARFGASTDIVFEPK